MKLLFLDGTKGFEPRRIGNRPTGGIIGSLVILPRLLSTFGHEVYVACPNLPEEDYQGVHYRAHGDCVVPDVVVFNRNFINRQLVDIFDCHKVWWLHDIADPRYLEDDGYRAVDAVIALSQYNVETFHHFYDVPYERFTVIPNGVDRSVFYGGYAEQRNKNLMICASAPIKGLQPIEYLYTNLKRYNPDFELRLYCSNKLHDFPEEERVTRLLNRFAEIGIKVLDPIPQKDLADVMRESWALLMPNSYPEICSNLLLQAQACGLPVIASNIGSVSEFIRHESTGLLTSWPPHDIFNWWKDFTMQAFRLWQEPELHERISRATPKRVRSWENIAALWNKFLCHLTGEKFVNSTVEQVSA